MVESPEPGRAVVRYHASLSQSSDLSVGDRRAGTSGRRWIATAPDPPHESGGETAYLFRNPQKHPKALRRGRVVKLPAPGERLN
jgi:hypothetical protein